MLTTERRKRYNSEGAGGSYKAEKGRGAEGKTSIFSIIKRNGKALVEVAGDALPATLNKIIKFQN